MGHLLMLFNISEASKELDFKFSHTMAELKVDEPFPISAVAGRYFLYDADVITYIRREYHILGVLVGTLPHVPQQNVFLGLPLELMPEEARLLVEKGVAFVVDDVEAHKSAFLLGGLSIAERQAVENILGRQGRESAMLQLKRADEKKENALRKISAEKLKKVRDVRAGSSESPANEDEASLFGPEGGPSSRSESPAPSSSSNTRTLPNAITPAISYPGVPLNKSLPSSAEAIIPSVPPSYPLYYHLHSQGYFINPGMRFGCNYLVYPGDSLRYHSHFLAVGKEWDEEIPLLDLVGGGRLGTGVKKGFCIGGQVVDEDGNDTGKQRAFVMEWAGM